MVICAQMTDVYEPRLRFGAKTFGPGNDFYAPLLYAAEKCRATNKGTQPEVATRLRPIETKR